MRKLNASLLNLGAFFMLMAFFFQNITIVSNDYRIVLHLALACMVLADVCFAIVASRGDGLLRSAVRGGDLVLRFFAAILAAPSFLIIWDFLRRAPYMFGR